MEYTGEGRTYFHPDSYMKILCMIDSLQCSSPWLREDVFALFRMWKWVLRAGLYAQVCPEQYYIAVANSSL